MLEPIRPALVLLLLFTLLCGVVYPLAVTALAQTFLSGPANGSIVAVEGRAVGSRLIGQAFHSPEYFWSRPSATAPFPYNAGASSGSNLGPTNPALASAVADRVRELRAADPTNQEPVPVGLVTASASGLDPELDSASAQFQVGRVARARRLSESTVQQIVAAHTRPRTFGILGEPRVNVLELNIALDAVRPRSRLEPNSSRRTLYLVSP